MWACVRSWPLTAKLPGGACVAFVGPIVPAATLTSEASPRWPSASDWEHSHGTAEVVGDEQVVSARVHADIGRPGAARTHGVQQLQLSVGPIDGERGDAALLVVADPIGLVRGIEAGAVAAEGEATRARADLDCAEGRHRSSGAIDPKEMNATAIPRRQIDLRRERVAKRGAEGPDIADQRRGISGRSGLFQEMSHRKDPCECG